VVVLWDPQDPPESESYPPNTFLREWSEHVSKRVGKLPLSKLFLGPAGCWMELHRTIRKISVPIQSKHEPLWDSHRSYISQREWQLP